MYRMVMVLEDRVIRSDTNGTEVFKMDTYEASKERREDGTVEVRYIFRGANNEAEGVFLTIHPDEDVGKFEKKGDLWFLMTDHLGNAPEERYFVYVYADDEFFEPIRSVLPNEAGRSGGSACTCT